MDKQINVKNENQNDIKQALLDSASQINNSQDQQNKSSDPQCLDIQLNLLYRSFSNINYLNTDNNTIQKENVEARASNIQSSKDSKFDQQSDKKQNSDRGHDPYYQILNSDQQQLQNDNNIFDLDDQKNQQNIQYTQQLKIQNPPQIIQRYKTAGFVEKSDKKAVTFQNDPNFIEKNTTKNSKESQELSQSQANKSQSHQKDHMCIFDHFQNYMKIEGSKGLREKDKSSDENIINQIYKSQNCEDFARNLIQNSKVIKHLQHKKQKRLNKSHDKDQLNQNDKDYNRVIDERQTELNSVQSNQISFKQDDIKVGLHTLLNYKVQVKYQLQIIHFSKVMVSIRKKYREKIFMSLVFATFFQFFVDTFLTQIESVVGFYMYDNVNGISNYQTLNSKVTIYYALFNVAIFPLLSGFIVDQIHCSIVMRTSVLVMFLGRMISLFGILVSTFQIRIIGQFFYQFGDSVFYLTSIYTIYFYYYDPKKPRKFVQNLVKYLGLGCSLPRNLVAIPMIFVYLASNSFFKCIQSNQSINVCQHEMPLLFIYPYKIIIYSLISFLVLVTIILAYRAVYFSKIAQKEMSDENLNYLDNPLFKASITDIVQNIVNFKYFRIILAGGIVYGLTSKFVIKGINKQLYDLINPDNTYKINNQTYQIPDLQLFIITQGHELFYIIFIWSFGKIMMRDFSQKYKIWLISAGSCTIYFLIHLLVWAILNYSHLNIEYSSFKYLFYIFLFVINIFSGVSFSTNVLCVDSILSKIIKKNCIGFGYACMIVFKEFFEFLGNLSLEFQAFNNLLQFITISLCIFALFLIRGIYSNHSKTKLKKKLHQYNISQQQQ